jgi:hypothetical protein
LITLLYDEGGLIRIIASVSGKARPVSPLKNSLPASGGEDYGGYYVARVVFITIVLFISAIGDDQCYLFEGCLSS